MFGSPGQIDLRDESPRRGVHSRHDFRHRPVHRAVERVEADRRPHPGAHLAQVALFDRRLQPVRALALDGHQRRARRNHVPRLHHLLGHHSSKRRHDRRVSLLDARRVRFFARLRDLRFHLLAPRHRHVEPRLGHPDAGRSLVEFLVGNRRLVVQVLHPAERRLRQFEVRFGRLDRIQRFGFRAPRLGKSGIGLPLVRFDFARIHHHQHLPLLHPVAHAHLDLARDPHYPAGHLCGSSGPHRSYRVVESGPVGLADHHGPDRHRRAFRLHAPCRLRFRAASGQQHYRS